MHARSLSLLLLFVVALVFGLSACGVPSRLSYGQRMATAETQGCWEGALRTPLPVTVTPLPVTVEPTQVVNPGDPTHTPAPSATPLPTTTPLPRCTPQPGETLEPWPTPWPTHAPVPTRTNADHQFPVVDRQSLMLLPNPIFGMSLAVHPTEGWPVVAAVDVPFGQRGAVPRVFVRVYDPARGGWQPTQHVSTHASAPERSRTVAVAVAGDGAIHVVWGVTEFPAMGLYASTSRDRGQTWSAPHLLGSYRAVLDATATLDNHLFVLALRHEAAADVDLFHRTPDGVWQPKQTVPTNGATWSSSAGALLVVGDGVPGVQRALVAAVTTYGSRVDLYRKGWDDATWTMQHRMVGQEALWTIRGVSVDLPDANGGGVSSLVGLQMNPRFGAGGVYALTSRDGGVQWGEAEEIVRADGATIEAVAVAADPVAQAWISVWTCCAGGLWGNGENTHFASWRTLDAPAWKPASFAERVPLVSGGAAVGSVAIAQPRNLPIVWMAWVENAHEVMIRTLDVRRIVPTLAYPTPTPTSPPGGAP
ncbi:hypothetical protein [Candidatus Viridilinea mediisalina]|uniref:Sialidase domain-containing protein n=1 Tax=Candidatus Viridilinea mediisalina TaxID=2024553 RepID=A0A2A6REJ8_9CHLR|nr:hypothetical protein [Candidatus Viridilinea mediisalina]PDW01179.1 hypothetical protein CJ255_19510 [Candidatus Viridilinea mediisalina]